MSSPALRLLMTFCRRSSKMSSSGTANEDVDGVSERRITGSGAFVVRPEIMSSGSGTVLTGGSSNTSSIWSCIGDGGVYLLMLTGDHSPPFFLVSFSSPQFLPWQSQTVIQSSG
ncbi:hypothetical protein KC19_VG051100 [Ceratodon purpureus]|uniref:Uncharacterized protein n=1 Tax=Ceratodon purpureus TaxID=3225 RepID=A0A8T0HM65_CERPU|nr:hypothetical protein KC19_VG051100 [Ceratodon purpureus]